MKVRFYPRDIGMWRKVFDFSGIEMNKKKFVDFENRVELIDFLKQHGIRLDDPEFPLEFKAGAPIQDGRQLTHTVIQWSCVGWISEK